MSRVLATTLLCGLVLAAFGCTSGAARYAGELPGSRLSEMSRFYVQHQPDDKRDIHLAIQEEMKLLGLSVDAGMGAPSQNYDAIVTYADRYAWDITMFCAQLTLYVRDTRTDYITATGWSWRPATVRKTPKGHARLILREMFGNEPK